MPRQVDSDPAMRAALDRISSAVAGRYRVERVLGAGGMATVYLADDLRHQRRVALKVLRPEIAQSVGADRFLAEIRTTANLQHPHILPLFDSGLASGATPDDAGLLYYVMPFVEGESLRQRLTREKQLPLADAIRIALEVAEALDYAHRRGILHRDIKPENILLHDGHALVADFGIALALTHAAEGGAARLTGTGISIGTPHYMSPEQAAGERNLDARTDVYALGATLYEMLAGEPPFSGASAQIVMARAATERPRPIRDTRARVPAPVDAAVMTALQPLPADRFSSAAEMSRALRGAVEEGADRTGAAPHRIPWRPVLAAGALVALTVLATRAWLQRKAPSDGARVSARLTLPLPADQIMQAGSVRPFAISSDGSLVAYVAAVGETSQIYLRPLDAAEGRAVPSSTGAQGPVFSPDGRWIGYHADGKLWKVAVAGGAPLALADAESFCGASWGDGGDAGDAILFSECDGALHVVSSRGGDEREVPVRIEPAEPDSAGSGAGPRPLDVRWPELLPDRRHALVGERGRIGIVDLRTGALRLLRGGVQATYLRTGHLLFDEGEGRVRLVRFDPDRLAIVGEPVPAFETFRGPNSGSSFFSVSENGTLVHVAGGFARWLVLTDRSGRTERATPEPRGYRFPNFSPDGRRIAVTVDPRPSDIWIVDPADWRATRVTTSGGNIAPIWSRDGKRIAFTKGSAPQWVGGPGEDPRPLNRVPAGGPVYLDSWASDGTLLGVREAGRRQYDIVMLAPGDSAWRDLLASSSVERDAMLSPDERWIAYTSNRSGNAEVYVRPRAGTGVGAVVSAGGGREPRWGDGGREVVYRSGSRIMSVPVQTAPNFQLRGSPRELFIADYDFTQDNNWDMTADGRRFVFVRSDAAARRGLIVVVNWFDAVHRMPE